MIKTMEVTMQTLTIEVKDDVMAEFMNVLDSFKGNIKVTKDKNLELDPYFYERQEKLQQIIENESNTISHDKLWSKVHKHLETIKSK